MNKIHQKFIGRINHENKDFEHEAKRLFTELFSIIEEKEKEWDASHPEPRGLDGGFNSRKLTIEYYKKLEDLKIKYNITDK